jgi:hypothetical protein
MTIDAVLLWGDAMRFSTLSFALQPGVVFNEFAPPSFPGDAHKHIHQRFMALKSLQELALAVRFESPQHVLFAVPASKF